MSQFAYKTSSFFIFGWRFCRYFSPYCSKGEIYLTKDFQKGREKDTL